ncbi:hypothetical protein [Rickettsia conorii]|uniref:hypothetical protein n=1 Tax=Rickettsia conorii TaxID=781 RepID=UPI002260BD25|nr:hypothetical protein [Rickettsia conorii]UZW38768.1 hypothetical protein OSR38_00435 [Rickettsia conorii subsp. heilongjiangensis]
MLLTDTVQILYNLMIAIFTICIEDTIKPYFNRLFEIVKIWTEKSKRFSPSKEALWLNFIVKKSKTILLD